MGRNQNQVWSFFVSLFFFFFRAHWFLVVVCFPALEDVQYESFPSPTGEICRTVLFWCGSHDRSDLSEGDASEWLMF